MSREKSDEGVAQRYSPHLLGDYKGDLRQVFFSLGEDETINMRTEIHDFTLHIYIYINLYIIFLSFIYFFSVCFHPWFSLMEFNIGTNM